METIGSRLLELRKSKNITQEQLAEELNVSRQSISNWELDKSLPDTDRLLALALIYEVSLDYLAYGKVDENQPDKTLAGIMDLLTDSEIAERKNRSVAHLLWIGALAGAVLLIPMLILYVGIMTHLANPDKIVSTDVASIDRIIEQYTLAEVTQIDDKGNFHKDKVWLDSRNMAENSYIFVQKQENAPGKMKFEYYEKTMMIPFVGVVCLLLIEGLLFAALYRIYSKKARK